MKKLISFSCFNCLIVWILLLFAANQSMATTYCVSDEANLIAALNEAKANGADDVIKIQQGTYNGNFAYDSTESFGLTIEGGYTAVCASRVVDPANTILDGGGAGTVLGVTNNEFLQATFFVMEGITLQNGNSYWAGGIFCPGGISTLNNNAFINNSGIGCGLSGDCSGGGGAITLTNNTISNNSGDGVYSSWLTTETPNLTNNTISNNSGFGIRGYFSGTLNLTNNTISNNNKNGIYLDFTSGNLKDNTISNNNGGIGGFAGQISAINNIITNNGGGIGGDRFHVNLTSNTISNNSHYGVHLGRGNATLVNNVIINNGDITRFGSGVFIYDEVGGGSTIDITNNTISNNSGSNGGGIYLNILDTYGGITNIYNNIIWNNNNSVGSGADLYLYDPAATRTINLYNNDFDQSANGTYIDPPIAIDPSNLNNVDPLFVDLANGDFHLQPASPCKDAGKDAGVYVDFDGDHRPLFSGFDMGADELQIDDLVIDNQTLSTTQGFGACETITAGPAVNVTPTGDVNFQAGTKVSLKSGFSVEDGGRLSVVVDPSTCP